MNKEDLWPFLNNEIAENAPKQKPVCIKAELKPRLSKSLKIDDKEGSKIDTIKRISKVYEASEEILFDDSSRFILMSDCHRGDGSWADNFAKNQNLFFTALLHYYRKNYTYIEIGDGDELWENSDFYDIVQTHSDAFWLMSNFYSKGRLYLLYGNHDIVKQSKKYVEENLYQYFDEREKKYMPLFEKIKVHEGLILKHRVTGDKIFLIHGHQVSFFNSTLWRLGRFLAKNLWRPLEVIGIKDPTSAAKNYSIKENVEKRLVEWVKEKKHMLIAGHTHRPIFPEVGEIPYFNDGSCVHPRCITGIEIADGNIMLIKWSVKANSDGALYVYREVLAGPNKLTDYFNAINGRNVENPGR